MKFETYRETQNYLIIVFDTEVWSLPVANKFFITVQTFLYNKDYKEVIETYKLFKIDEASKKGKECVKQSNHIDRSKIPVKIPVTIIKNKNKNKNKNKGVVNDVDHDIYEDLKIKKQQGELTGHIENFLKKAKMSSFLVEKSRFQKLYSYIKNNHISICDDGSILLAKLARSDSDISKKTIYYKLDESKKKLNSYIASLVAKTCNKQDILHGIDSIVGLSYTALASYYPAKHIFEIKVNPRHVFAWGFLDMPIFAFSECRIVRLITLGKNNSKLVINVFNSKQKKKKSINKQRRKTDILETSMVNIPLKIGARNRVCVIKKLLQAIDATYKTKVKCEYTKKKIVISLMSDTDITSKKKLHIYTVDADNTFKISGKIIEASGLATVNTKQQICADVIDNVILIKVKSK